MDSYIGMVLENRYELLERIGSGGMSVVYKAKDTRLNRLVAVKILRSDLAQDEEFRHRFHAESQAVAQLSSPHIVSVYDVSKGGEMEYIVMELIDGITLKQYMERRGQLNWRESLHFIIQIMRGVSHAHSHGIVHRDIKPQNIMVLRDGSVKVADFGIAVLENSAQTLTQQALGSVHYISPEQAKGERTDARSDIYSAGVVFYEMLTNRLPFEGESAVSVAIQHLSSTPPDPRQLNPDIPPQLELICLKAMAPDLKRRYANAEEMIRDLEAFRRDPGIRLDFRMEDLRPPVTDEPTRYIRTPGGIPHEQEQETKPASRTGMALLAVGAVAAVVLIVVLFRVIFSSFGGEEVPETYLVQSLVGYTVQQAENLEGVRGIFEIVEEGTQYSDEYPAGVILRQDPAPDRYRKGNNLVIRVWVSSGEETGVMPDVIGQTVSEAELRTLRDLIRKYSLKLEMPEEERQYRDDYPAGQIFRSVPKAGDTLHKSDTIRLSVSNGPKTVTLISFVSMTLDEANSKLKEMNLNSGNPEFVYDEAAFGTVLKQTPAPNTEVREHTEVAFTVSRGPKLPDPEQILQVTIPLPDDREKAYLEVWKDGERIWSDEVDCTAGSKTLELSGKGECLLEVYLDREEAFHDTVSIDNRSEPLVLELKELSKKPDSEILTEDEPDTESDISEPDQAGTDRETDETPDDTPETSENPASWIGSDIIAEEQDEP